MSASDRGGRICLPPKKCGAVISADTVGGNGRCPPAPGQRHGSAPWSPRAVDDPEGQTSVRPLPAIRTDDEDRPPVAGPPSWRPGRTSSMANAFRECPCRGTGGNGLGDGSRPTGGAACVGVPHPEPRRDRASPGGRCRSTAQRTGSARETCTRFATAGCRMTEWPRLRQR